MHIGQAPGTQAMRHGTIFRNAHVRCGLSVGSFFFMGMAFGIFEFLGLLLLMLRGLPVIVRIGSVTYNGRRFRIEVARWSANIVVVRRVTLLLEALP